MAFKQRKKKCFCSCQDLRNDIPEKRVSWCKGLMEGMGLLCSRIRRNAGVELGRGAAEVEVGEEGRGQGLGGLFGRQIVKK